MGRAPDLHSGGRGFESSWWTDFFRKSILLRTHFLNSALITLLLGITSTHRYGNWAILNTRLLGTRICWLLIDSCFCSFITVRWRHWCRGKTVNSCCTFLSKSRRQTVVNHLSSHPKPNFFFGFWTFLKHFFFIFIVATMMAHILGFCFDTLATV